MKIYSVTSGKGGVGKTSLICNMAARMGQMGHRVLLVDADMGLANVDIVMGLKPKATLKHLFDGEAPIESILVPGPENVTVLPASSGVPEMSLLSDEQIMSLMEALDGLEQPFDVLLVDTGAGIGKNVLYFNAATKDVLVVATPQPTSITDAYAMMKVLSTEHKVKKFRLIVNQVTSRKQALRVYGYLTNVADQYLVDVAIDYLGHVSSDPAMLSSIMDQTLLMQSNPDAPSAECISNIVETLLGEEIVDDVGGNMQFFWRRLARQEAAPEPAPILEPGREPESGPEA